jgi:ferredoxin-NADP reductase
MTVAQKMRCRVERTTDHGQQVYTVDLLPERRAPAFQPGQFLHLALDPYDPGSFWPESRVFSIASAPTQRDRLSITYSVRGRFTARMEKELAEGQFVWIKLPYGDFVIQGSSDLVLFAGGTGVTAFTAFLNGLTPTFPCRVYLAYGARDASLLIYRNVIEERANSVTQLNPYFFVEEQRGGTSAARPEIPGRLSVAKIWPYIEQPLAATYYLSGPPPMLKAISRDLADQGVRAGAIRVDAWE